MHQQAFSGIEREQAVDGESLERRQRQGVWRARAGCSGAIVDVLAKRCRGCHVLLAEDAGCNACFILDVTAMGCIGVMCVCVVGEQCHAVGAAGENPDGAWLKHLTNYVAGTRARTGYSSSQCLAKQPHIRTTASHHTMAYTEQDIHDAIEKYDQGNQSIRSVAGISPGSTSQGYSRMAQRGGNGEGQTRGAVWWMFAQHGEIACGFRLAAWEEIIPVGGRWSSAGWDSTQLRG